MDNAKNYTENNALKNAGKNRKRIGNSAKENAQTEGRGANAKNHTANVNSTSTAAQRTRLLSYLREAGPITMLQVREELNIMRRVLRRSSNNPPRVKA